MEVRIENINQDVNLVADIKQLITNARLKVATVANAGITMLYWHIGERINREVLGNQRAEYGKRIVTDDAICRLFPGSANCVAIGDTIILDSFYGSFTDKGCHSTRVLPHNGC